MVTSVPLGTVTHPAERIDISTTIQLGLESQKKAIFSPRSIFLEIKPAMVLSMRSLICEKVLPSNTFPFLLRKVILLGNCEAVFSIS